MLSNYGININSLFITCINICVDTATCRCEWCMSAVQSFNVATSRLIEHERREWHACWLELGEVVCLQNYEWTGPVLLYYGRRFMYTVASTLFFKISLKNNSLAHSTNSNYRFGSYCNALKITFSELYISLRGICLWLREVDLVLYKYSMLCVGRWINDWCRLFWFKYDCSVQWMLLAE